MLCRFAEQMTATQWCERVQVQWGLWTYNNERPNMASVASHQL